MAPDGLSHKFGITQSEHPVEIVRCRKDHVGGPGMGPASSQVPDRRAQPGAAYQVRVHLVLVLAMFLGSQSAGIVRLPARALNFSDAQN